MLSEEPFGPIAPILRFADLDEALARANALPYGLAAYAFTHRADVAARLTRGLEAGILSINHVGGSVPQAPSGGFKESGHGREGGSGGPRRLPGDQADLPQAGHLMRWCRFREHGEARYGQVEDDEVAGRRRRPFGDHRSHGAALLARDRQWLPPVVPPTFYAVGMNYLSHVREAATRGVEVAVPARPEVGYRANNALTGHRVRS